MSNIPNFKLVLDMESIAKVLWIPKEAALVEFSDGRVISRFSEHWAKRLYDLDKCENTNTAGYDLYLRHTLFGLKTVAVRSLTNSGIKFQDSKYIGSGRKCEDEDLLRSLEGVTYEIVVDITECPEFHLLPVDGATLIKAFYDKNLTCSGWNKKTFYRTIFNVESPKELHYEEIMIK